MILRPIWSFNLISLLWYLPFQISEENTYLLLEANVDRR
jgi:hypothetical protein